MDDELHNRFSNLAIDDKPLGNELRRIEQQYLKSPLTDDERSKPALVQFITENFILKELRDTLSGVTYTGSSYEYTAVPGRSDYDIQYYLKLPITRQNHARVYGANVVECGDPAWRKVRGGPVELLDQDGYLSTLLARNQVQSKIDRALELLDHSLVFRGSSARITRSMHGPATTLNVRWRDIRLDIDIVVCLKAEDLGGSYGEHFKYDLVGKPNNEGAHMWWRVSYSPQEVEKLRSFHYNNERKLTLLRIMKVIKRYQTQLAYYPSYFYKNILFKMDADNPRSSWDRADLAARFKDMIKLIYECLRAEYLPLHFNEQVNFLEHTDSLQMRETSNYLQNIINMGLHIRLVQAVPDTAEQQKRLFMQSLRGPEEEHQVVGTGQNAEQRKRLFMQNFLGPEEEHQVVGTGQNADERSYCNIL